MTLQGEVCFYLSNPILFNGYIPIYLLQGDAVKLNAPAPVKCLKDSYFSFPLKALP